VRGPAADVGVFGGSGLYSLLDEVEELTVETPWGRPSGPLHVGRVGERRVAFLPRHGPAHEHPAHRVNYRANLWAMRQVGARAVIGPCAVGSLQPGIHPGDFVVCDQLVDRTSGRKDTFFDGPGPHHVGFAEPYCGALRAVLSRSAAELGLTSHETGTVVVIQGPRFSTRAESSWYRDQGWHVVNMTQHPEAVLARELGICYSTVALVTDYDAGLTAAGVEPVSQEEVLRVFEENLDRLRALLFTSIAALPDPPGCGHPPVAGGRRCDAQAPPAAP
jgi:5'-methylthioadenosine phosphorylase